MEVKKHGKMFERKFTWKFIRKDERKEGSFEENKVHIEEHKVWREAWKKRGKYGKKFRRDEI